MKRKIIDAIDKYKIIAILRGIPSDKLIATVQALYDGGIRLVEITFSTDGSVSDEETAELIRMLSEHFEGKLFVGAGTVITINQVMLTAKNGGKFIISPDTNKEIIKKSAELSLVSIPGALTPTEIVSAKKYGADYVKLFPVSNLGSDYVKALTAPLKHIKLLAVGGIDTENMSEYIKAGVQGFGIGSNIADKNLIEKCEFEKLTFLAREYVKVLEDE